MSCARSKGIKGIEREGKRSKDESLLLNTSTRSKKRDTKRNKITISCRAIYDTLEGDAPIKDRYF